VVVARTARRAGSPHWLATSSIAPFSAGGKGVRRGPPEVGGRAVS